MLRKKKWLFLSDDVSSSPNQSYRRTIGGVGSCSSNPKSDHQRQLALHEQHDVRWSLITTVRRSSTTTTTTTSGVARVNQHPPVHQRGWMVHWWVSLFYPCAIPGWIFFSAFSQPWSQFLFVTLFYPCPLPPSQFFFSSGTLFSPRPPPSFFFFSAFWNFSLPTHLLPPTVPHPLTHL